MCVCIQNIYRASSKNLKLYNKNDDDDGYIVNVKIMLFTWIEQSRNFLTMANMCWQNPKNNWLRTVFFLLLFVHRLDLCSSSSLCRRWYYWQMKPWREKNYIFNRFCFSVHLSFPLSFVEWERKKVTLFYAFELFSVFFLCSLSLLVWSTKFQHIILNENVRCTHNCFSTHSKTPYTKTIIKKW